MTCLGMFFQALRQHDSDPSLPTTAVFFAGDLPPRPSRGQVRQGRAFEVGVDLLDDRVPTVGLVRGHRVGHLGAVVVKNPWKRQVSKRLLTVLGAWV